MKRIKKIMKTPSNAVVMSLMAVILICAAPALVSIIDDSYNHESSIYTGPLEKSNPSLVPTVYLKADAPDEIDKTYTFVPAADNSGVNFFTLNVSANAEYVGDVYGFEVDKDSLSSSRIQINIDSPGVSRVALRYTFAGVQTWINGVPVLNDDGLSTGSYTFDVSSLNRVKIQENDDVIPYIVFSMNSEFDGTIIWDSECYGSVTIPYGEIIIGATGALLLICALLATPWFGTSGLTIKRRR